MKNLYKNSYWFWIISKIILIILLLLSTLSLLANGGLRINEILVNLLGFIEAILLIITLRYDFLSDLKSNYLKEIGGIILIIFGIVLFVVLLFFVPKGSRNNFFELGYPFSLWMILVGIFDFLKIRNPISTK